MNLSGGELADMLPTGDDPGNALLIQESFGPAEASNRRCHLTSHSDPALRFARGVATSLTLTAPYAGSLANLANADSSNAAVCP